MSISTFLRVTIVFVHFRQDRILRQATDFEMTDNITMQILFAKCIDNQHFPLWFPDLDEG